MAAGGAAGMGRATSCEKDLAKLLHSPTVQRFERYQDAPARSFVRDPQALGFYFQQNGWQVNGLFHGVGFWAT